MVAKIALDGLLLGGVHITLDNEVAILGHANIARECLNQPHRLTTQEASQQILIHIIGHRGRSGVGIDGVTA